MTVNGAVVELKEGFKVEFGDSIFYTQRHLEKRCKYSIKPGESIFGGTAIRLKNITFYDMPSKCILEYDKDKLAAITFKIDAVDYRAVDGPDDACEAARELAAMLCDKMRDIIGEVKKNADGTYDGQCETIRASVAVNSNQSPKVVTRIYPA